jgi:hypothetical protein
MQILLYFITDVTVDLLTNNLKSWGWFFCSFEEQKSHCHTTRFDIKYSKIEHVQSATSYSWSLDSRFCSTSGCNSDISHPNSYYLLNLHPSPQLHTKSLVLCIPFTGVLNFFFFSRLYKINVLFSIMPYIAFDLIPNSARLIDKDYLLALTSVS